MRLIRKSSFIKLAGVQYSGIVLDEVSREKVKSLANKLVSDKGEFIAHHLTLTLGPVAEEYRHLIGQKAILTATMLGISDKAVAIKCSPFIKFKEENIDWNSYPRKGKGAYPHVTVYVYREAGGKPVDSNAIKEFSPIEKFEISGTLSEI